MASGSRSPFLDINLDTNEAPNISGASNISRHQKARRRLSMFRLGTLFDLLLTHDLNIAEKVERVTVLRE